MSARAALSAWLKTNVGLREVFEEDGPAIEDMLPGAFLRYDGDRFGDVLDSTLRIERYTLALLAPIVGASEQQRADELSALEKAFVLAARGTARSNPAWSHLAADPVSADRGAGASLWTISLHVT